LILFQVLLGKRYKNISVPEELHKKLEELVRSREADDFKEL
jgi:hypothetical protein